MKIRIAFYMAKFEWRSFLKTRKIHLVDDIISWWTWPGNIGTGPYSHCEVWLPSLNGKFSHNTSEGIEYLGTCWTSTMRGDERGTCWRAACTVLKHPGRWRFKEYEISRHDFERGKYWMVQKVDDNKGYGFKDFATFIGLGWLIKDKYKDICSEFTDKYAVIAGIIPAPFEIVSPRKLSRMLPGKMQRLSDANT